MKKDIEIVKKIPQIETEEFVRLTDQILRVCFLHVLSMQNHFCADFSYKNLPLFCVSFCLICSSERNSHANVCLCSLKGLRTIFFGG